MSEIKEESVFGADWKADKQKQLQEVSESGNEDTKKDIYNPHEGEPYVSSKAVWDQIQRVEREIEELKSRAEQLGDLIGKEILGQMSIEDRNLFRMMFDGDRDRLSLAYGKTQRESARAQREKVNIEAQDFNRRLPERYDRDNQVAVKRGNGVRETGWKVIQTLRDADGLGLGNVRYRVSHEESDQIRTSSRFELEEMQNDLPIFAGDQFLMKEGDKVIGSKQVEKVDGDKVIFVLNYFDAGNPRHGQKEEQARAVVEEEYFAELETQDKRGEQILAAEKLQSIATKEQKKREEKIEETLRRKAQEAADRAGGKTARVA